MFKHNQPVTVKGSENTTFYFFKKLENKALLALEPMESDRPADGADVALTDFDNVIALEEKVGAEIKTPEQTSCKCAACSGNNPVALLGLAQYIKDNEDDGFNIACEAIARFIDADKETQEKIIASIRMVQEVSPKIRALFEQLGEAFKNAN